MTKAIITFDRVNKIYISRAKRKKTALKEFSLEVKKGEVFGIIGLNGAGKSSSLKVLTGLNYPTSGSVKIGNAPNNIPASLERLGFLPENPCLYRNLSPYEHLNFAGISKGLTRKKIKDRSEYLLDLVKLTSYSHKPIKSFSKGMVQRAALAYALFRHPEILVLDEPMSGLDPLGQELVVNIIRDYNKEGHTILFCSHILTDVERICDRIGILHQGTLVQITTPHQLQKSYSHITSVRTPLESFFFDTVKPPLQ